MRIAKTGVAWVQLSSVVLLMKRKFNKGTQPS
ncbi:protein of unknown function (plasmid) [Cupriavidus taiwanensis]|uniref:Uncharacterized protein n=1 Tax=Cupriavidus taiwanensis TaxID=164546 RepID=A0A9Q7UYV4_9BURK|nr:protein of unknown function [Cupriavidus taiwanensis]